MRFFVMFRKLTGQASLWPLPKREKRSLMSSNCKAMHGKHMRRGYISKKKSEQTKELFNKNTEFYSATVNAWFNTRFEHDKSLLTLSAGGIGLLITLISTIGISSRTTLALYTLSIISFITSLCVLLWIFKRNAKHLEDIVSNTATSDKFLQNLDSIAIYSFILGIILAFALGFITALNKLNEKEDAMSQNKISGSKTLIACDSVNNALKMAPTGSTKLSVEGINKMAPANNSSTPQAKPNTTQTPKK